MVAADNGTIQEYSLLAHMASGRVRVYAAMLFHDVAFTGSITFRIYRSSEHDLTLPQKEFYPTRVQLTEEQPVKVCVETRGQDNTKWPRERKVQITGSTRRTYFTYVPKNR